jgi:hypothetical protein
MNNYLASFSNKREMSFNATTLHNAKQVANAYASKQGIYVNRVMSR